MNDNLRLYCFGGNTKNFVPVVHISCKEINSGEWDAVAKMPVTRADFGGAVVDGKVYLAGGTHLNKQPLSSMDVYDCKFQKWSTLAPLPDHRNNFGMAAHNGYLYVTGGSANAERFSWNDRRRDCFKYSIETNKWSKISSMNCARIGHQLVQLGCYLYAIGGLHWEDQPTVERYDPQNNTWRYVRNTNFKYTEPGAVAHDGRIYVAGHDAFEVYTPLNDRWTVLQAPTDFQKSNRVLISAGHRLLSLGGSANSTFKRTVIEYNIDCGKWRKHKAMDIERDKHCCFVVHF